jgi:hypothetical protein
MARAFLIPMLALLLAGCLPGQQRSSPRELFPADSLSRQIAEATPADTLAVVWQTTLPEGVRYPMSLVWEGGRIVVADLQTGSLHILGEDGSHAGEVADERFEYPLISGAEGDTIAVLSRGRREVHLVALDRAGGGRIVESLAIPDGRNQVAAWSRDRLFVKTADEDHGSAILEVDMLTGEVRSHPLPGPYWRHIGLLRIWGDSLVSLSGYRPVIDVLRMDAPAGTRPDTLALMGFDSPQLAHSRAFVLGDRREPPLLVPSAVAIGDRLFVLNARPGWAHVDVFRREGDELRLERSLISPDPEMGRNYFAADIAVRRVGDGFDIVVLEAQPRRAVVRYRWGVDA